VEDEEGWRGNDEGGRRRVTIERRVGAGGRMYKGVFLRRDRGGWDGVMHLV
jgi:hypothetical protein